MLRRRREAGLGLMDFILGAIALVFIVLLVALVVPAYSDYWQVRQTVISHAKKADYNTSKAKLVGDMLKELHEVHLIDDIGPSDISITKAKGKLFIRVDFKRQVQIVDQVSLCFDFEVKGESGG